MAVVDAPCHCGVVRIGVAGRYEGVRAGVAGHCGRVDPGDPKFFPIPAMLRSKADWSGNGRAVEDEDEDEDDFVWFIFPMSPFRMAGVGEVEVAAREMDNGGVLPFILTLKFAVTFASPEQPLILVGELRSRKPTLAKRLSTLPLLSNSSPRRSVPRDIRLGRPGPTPAPAPRPPP